MQGLRIRKLADRSGGEATLYADLPGAPSGTWPLAGVQVEGDVPDYARVPTSFVERGIHEGWLLGEGHEVVIRPAGPADEPWRVTPSAPSPHVFHHYTKLTLLTLDGPVTYQVVHQPDKYADPGAANDPGNTGGLAKADDETPVTAEVYAAGATRVDWFYDLREEG